MDIGDCVILDIDAGFATVSNEMSSDLPELPKEYEMLKLLSRIKNQQMDVYDKVYSKEKIPPRYNKETYIVQQIRELFFNELAAFLKPAYLSIDLSIPNPENLYQYFKREKYLDYLQDETDPDYSFKYIKFAKDLLDTKCFAHFMDGYLEEDVVNFDLVNSILCE